MAAMTAQGNTPATPGVPDGPPDTAQKPAHAWLPTAIDAEARRMMVAQAAYFRAEKRGFAAGSELDDWLEAEREIARLLDG